MHHCRVEALQHQQSMLHGQLQRVAGIAKGDGKCLRTQREAFAFQRRMADQYGEAVAQFEQRRAMASLATGHQLVQRHRLLVLGLVQQFQWTARCLGFFHHHRCRTESAEVVAHAFHEATLERIALLLQQLAAQQVLLLFEVVARALGKRIEALFDIAQAQPYRRLQPTGAEGVRFFDQTTRARRPAGIVGTMVPIRCKRLTSTLLFDIHDRPCQFPPEMG